MSERYMQDGEIYRSYKTAINPQKQIEILADLNAISKKEVSEIILREQKKEKQLNDIYEQIQSNKNCESAMTKLKKAIEENAIDTYSSICERLDELEILINGYTHEYKKLSELLKRR